MIFEWHNEDALLKVLNVKLVSIKYCCTFHGTEIHWLVKHVNEMPFFPKLPSDPVTHQLSHILETVCWFYIYFLYFVWRNKLLFIHSITKKHKFISIVKNFETFCQNTLRFCPKFRQIKTFGGALSPSSLPAPTRLPEKAWTPLT